MIVNTPATKDGVNNLLLNAYGLLDGVYRGQVGAVWATGTDNWLYGSVAGGDAHKGSTPDDQTDASSIENYTSGKDNNFLDPKWKINIIGIHYANAVLQKLPLVKDGLTAEQSNQLVAEARFLRGFYELELAKLWKNVPYIDETAVYDNGYSDVSNPGPIWDKIEADFTAAMATLPATQAQIGRPNKYAAEAFLAKTLMFDHKYAQAKTALADLINNGLTSSGAKYALVHYADNFNPSTKNGSEGVFVIQATVHDGAGGYNGNAGDILNFPNHGPGGCCGFFQPTFSLVNAFKANAVTGLPLLDTYNVADLKNDEGVPAADSFTPSTETIDSRLDWTVGRRGIPYLDWGLMPGITWTGAQEYEGPFVSIKTVFYQAAQATTSETFDGWAPNQATSNGYNAIRYADVLLWAAEAEVETGNLQQAENYVNMVRTRAADPAGWVHRYRDDTHPMEGYTTIPAANYKVGLYGAAGGDAATGFAANGQTYARKAVYHERMIELGMEGHRFFDLQRWDGAFGGPTASGYMANTLNAYINHESHVANFNPLMLLTISFTAGKSELYPIPASAISAGNGKIKQNPGY